MNYLVVLVVTCLVPAAAGTGGFQVSLRGSVASQQRQNAVAGRHELSFIKDDAHLRAMRKEGRLVRLPHNSHVIIDRRLATHLRWCRPWVRTYLETLGRDFYRKFGVPLQINSAVRTVKHQRELRKRNRNAAPVSGPRASSHLTGSTVDIAKLPLTREQKAWLQDRLLREERNGLIEATEEHHQAVFHVMVFPPVKMAERK